MISRLQLKYSLTVLFIVIFVTAVVGGGIYYSIRAALLYHLPEPTEQGLTFAVLFGDVNRFLLAVLPVVLVMVIAVSLIFLSKITSPEMRLEKSLRALTNGDFSVETESRRGEELATLVRLVNQVKEKLSRTMIEEKEIADKVFVVANQILQAAEKPNANKAEIARLAGELIAPLEQLQIIIARHKVNRPIE